MRTGTAIGCRASHELCSNYLFHIGEGSDIKLPAPVSYSSLERPLHADHQSHLYSAIDPDVTFSTAVSRLQPDTLSAHVNSAWPSLHDFPLQSVARLSWTRFPAASAHDARQVLRQMASNRRQYWGRPEDRSVPASKAWRVFRNWKEISLKEQTRAPGKVISSLIAPIITNKFGAF